jgi:glutamate-1-semialdehyde 2,1-aminomutase
MRVTTSTTFADSLAIFPGGTQLFSKRPELFTPRMWPTYYKKAKGIDIWDPVGRRYKDMSVMGVGACVLGYANSFVDRRVKRVIDAGVQSTLIAEEEMTLAHRLVELHPWSNMVRFARSGGEAVSIAIRIARLATNKDVILFSGYHGWSDWYLAANLRDSENLGKVLLPGLSPRGVPEGLRNTAIPFAFNDLKMFRQVFEAHRGKIAGVIMEPRRSEEANPEFLAEIRKTCDQEGIVLIFDEITTGWRANSGGIHLRGSIMPDVAVMAKAMSNGYAMSAVIGRSEVMEMASTSFISSTNWTERVGLVAALSTIDFYEKERVDKHILRAGKIVLDGWKECAESCGLFITTSDESLTSLPSFSFDYPFARGMSILFTEKMLQRNWLAYLQFRPSFAHDDKTIKRYLVDVYEVFAELASLASNRPEYLEEVSKAHPAPSIPRLTT